MGEQAQVRLANDSGTEAKKKKPDNVVSFGETSKQSVAGLKEYGTDEDNQENFQVLLEIKNGLFNTIGGQSVPAFVTYEMTITKDDYTGGDESFATVRGTVQGLLKKTDTFKFAHAFTYGVTGLEDSNTTVRLGIELLTLMQTVVVSLLSEVLATSTLISAIKTELKNFRRRNHGTQLNICHQDSRPSL